MQIILCPECGRWKFKEVATGKDIWIQPTENEVHCIEIINTSDPILILVKGLSEVEELCDYCRIKLQN